MSDNLEGLDALGLDALGMAAALAHNYAQDARGFLPLLAVFLEAAMPNETVVERRGGFFQKTKPVRKVTVALGDEAYTLEDSGHGPLSAQRTKTVRGIVLKTEPMPVEHWLAELSAQVSARAQMGERAFFALREMLG